MEQEIKNPSPELSGPRNSSKKLPTGRKLPGNYHARWGRLVDLVVGGKTWIDAFMIIYPEITDRQRGKQVIDQWKSRSENFKNLLKKRKINTLTGEKMSKPEIWARWFDIARFNVASIFMRDEEGNIHLNDDWLDIAKEKNVIKKIRVEKKTIETRSGENITTEVIDITPYSVEYALSKVGKLLGYEKVADKAPGNVQATQNNNYFMVNRIEQVRKVVEAEKLALPDGQEKKLDVPINDFIQKMMNAKIVRNGEDEE